MHDKLIVRFSQNLVLCQNTSMDNTSADDAIAAGRWRAVHWAVRQAVWQQAVCRIDGCMCTLSLGHRAGSGAASCVAAYGCVSASSLVRAGRQRRQPTVFKSRP